MIVCYSITTRFGLNSGGQNHNLLSSIISVFCVSEEIFEAAIEI